MKSMTKLLSLVLALTMVLGLMPVALAEEAAAPTAFLMYADAAWANQWWHDGSEPAGGLKVTEAEVTGVGDYTVGLDFTGTEAGKAEGLAFAAVGISDGEAAFPGYFIRINEIRVNGAAIEADKGYTSSDDGVVTRMNIYNEWVSDLPSDARTYDGYVDDANWMIVDPADFAAVETVEVDFSLLKYGVDTAYIMFADSSWERQYWLDGNEYGGVVATNADITAPGDYTVGLDFTGTDYGKAAGVAFTALGIKHGENTFPGMRIEITGIRVNGEAVDFGKGYTSSDDGVETRMNVFNEWVPEVPSDASVRSFDGSVDGTSAQIVDPAVFEEVLTYEIDFTLHPVTDTAYIMFANADWSTQYWFDGNDYEGVTPATVTVDGPGTYTIGLEFANASEGVAFMAIGVKTGEKTFPGYFVEAKEIKVNGEAIDLGKGYTSSDDSIETRENIMNEWVSDLPTDARRADADLEGASPIIVNKDAFVGVTSIEITFDFIYGEPPAEAGVVPYTEEEIAAVQAADYNAYIGVQSENYIFRNAWNEPNYGKDVEDGLYFNRLTGWDGDLAVDYAGSFADAAITGNGTYTVTLTTGEMGFGSDSKFHLLFVSTDIPGKAISQGVITISDVTVKFGEGRTQAYGELNADGEYLQIDILNDYQQSSEPVAYSMPGANETITITFTVSGLSR